MKLRDEVKENWGLVVPDDVVWYETDDEFVTNAGMGVRRNTEIFWRNVRDIPNRKSTEPDDTPNSGDAETIRSRGLR